MIRCPRCEHENPPSVKFCGECGGRLEAVCPACQAANPPANKFCHQCGGALTLSTHQGRILVANTAACVRRSRPSFDSTFET